MKLSRFLLTAGVAVLLGACSGKSKQPKQLTADDFLRPASMVYSSQDSLNISSLVSEFSANFSRQDFAACADMLFKVQNDSVFPLTNAERKGYVKAMSAQFHDIYGIRTSSFVLRSDKNNDVKVTVQIAEDGDLYKNIGTISLSLNPVFKDGNWYLTLLDKYAEGVEQIY